MVGQGRRRSSAVQGATAVRAWTARRRYASALAPLLLLLCLPAGTLRGEETLRIRIAWGGGSERLWRGTISVSDGQLSDPRPLGIEADEPGSMWLEGDGRSSPRLAVRQRTPRSYDCVDVLATAPLTARLGVQLVAADDPEHPATFETTLLSLLGEVQNKPLDRQGNRLLVQRSPGDALRVSVTRDSLVFSPGETLKFTLEPHLLPLGDKRAKIRVQLSPARSQRELWSQQQTVHVTEGLSLPFEVPLKDPEGVYDVTISAGHAPSLPLAMRQPLSFSKVVAERTIQVVVVGPQGLSPAAAREPAEPAAIATIDPANPRWWDVPAKFPSLAKSPRLWNMPLGNGNLQTWKHSLGELVRLAPNAAAGDVSWEAYALPVAQPGRPHVVEVEYPSDVPQTLGVSIVEPDAAGAVMPVGLDSGVDVADELVVRTPRLLRHRLIFWPRSANPVLLVTNRRAHDPAVYGKIRVLAGWEHLPPAAAALPAEGERLVAAYFDRPLFPENFSATRSFDPVSGHCLDDWLTFYDGGRRMLEYLQHVGYNGLTVSVVGEGSALYPSARLQPTPRFDKGALQGSGQDPLRKDVLELLLRLCDRQRVRFLPAVDFNAPLPELETILRHGGPDADGLTWIGPDGNPLQQAVPPRRGLSPYYNTLHPRVQEAMLGVVRELAGRCRNHPSFAGVAVQLSAQGFAQLPGPQWGVDDATIERFQSEMQLRVPGEGPRRFAQRAEYLAGPGRFAWLQWRADTLARFYGRMQAELAAAQPAARLYLAGGNLLAGDLADAPLRPTLPRRLTLTDALLRVGFDPQSYRSDRGPVLLQPERLDAAAAAQAWAVDQEIRLLPDFDRCFQNAATAGSLFFQHPLETRVESFDQKSPFRPTYTWLVTQAAPSHGENRRRFVHSLAALDPQVLFDGGWLLPMGQEDALRGLLAAYRRLPAVRFERVSDAAEGTSQPVVFRTASSGGRTYLYAVNDSPLKVTAQVRVDVPAQTPVQELTGQRQVAGLRADAVGATWSVELEPYDLVAVQLPQAGVRISQPEVALPADAVAALDQRIRLLGDRAAALRNPPPLGVLTNAGFERAASGDDTLPDWAATQGKGVTIQADAEQPHGGRQSARLASTGPIACLVSKPFAAPASGRLSMSVWLRTADAGKQPPLRLAFEGRLGGQPYYRYAELGAAEGGAATGIRLGTQWAQYVFPVDDLPLDGLTQLRARFDLMGAGEVWVDDVQLFDLAFSEREHRELAKLITAAEYQLKNKQVGDCVRLLESYWPRFLERNVTVEPAAIAASPPPAASPSSAENRPAEPESPATPPTRSGMLERLKDLLPRF